MRLDPGADTRLACNVCVLILISANYLTSSILNDHGKPNQIQTWLSQLQKADREWKNTTPVRSPLDTDSRSFSCSLQPSTTLMSGIIFAGVVVRSHFPTSRKTPFSLIKDCY